MSVGKHGRCAVEDGDWEGEFPVPDKTLAEKQPSFGAHKVRHLKFRPHVAKVPLKSIYYVTLGLCCYVQSDQRGQMVPRRGVVEAVRGTRDVHGRDDKKLGSAGMERAESSHREAGEEYRSQLWATASGRPRGVTASY